MRRGNNAEDGPMSDRDYASLERRVAALEAKAAERDMAVAFMARINSAFLGAALETKPLSDCESKCVKDNPNDTEARLNCMLKCIADGK